VVRIILAIILAIVFLVVAVPILVALFLFPLRVETKTETGGGPVNISPMPSNLEALTVHDRLAIQLTWTSAAPQEWTYVLQRSAAGTEDSWVDLTELLPGSTSYLDEADLEDGHTYRYRIYGSTPHGDSGYTNVASAAATMLPQPEGSTLDDSDS
jgi:hypothetical protein